MKIAIIGSRKGVPAALVEAYMDTLPAGTIVISGECPYRSSVDQIAKWYALKHRDKFEYWPFPPDYKRYGSPAAFHVRNNHMALACERAAAFRASGKSKGTDGFIRRMGELGKPVEVIRVEPQREEGGGESG